eukprot:272933-Amphidinium_carterae.1
MKVLAVQVQAEEVKKFFPAGHFMASWGQPMLVEENDYLCAPLPAEGTEISEIYRIEKGAFAETYKPTLDSR